MYEKYLISYNDDNHDGMWYYDGEYIGNTTEEVAEFMFGEGMAEGEYSNTVLRTKVIYLYELGENKLHLTEKEIDIIHRSLCYGKDLDNTAWQLLIKEQYRDYVNYLKSVQQID